MKFTKKVLAKLERCYATSVITVSGKPRLLFATEGQGACYQFSYPKLEQSLVWDAPGGTMSMIAIPGKNGDFLAVQNFFPTFQAEHAVIVWCSPNQDGTWNVKNFISLPYVHRFDILKSHNKLYFLGATLCSSKKEKDDWSDPGQIWCGELPDSPEHGMELYSIKTGLLRNHGYNHAVIKGSDGLEHDIGLVTADAGVFMVKPPIDTSRNWTIEHILNEPVSDVAYFDIDGDGQAELACIEPFHGKVLCIRKKIGSEYKIVWMYDKAVDFGHVVWGGFLRGKAVFIFGYRKEGAELLLVSCDSQEKQEYSVQVIESGGGPSNIAVLNTQDEDIILCANRMVGDAVIYSVT